jgi:hypothetical protein
MKLYKYLLLMGLLGILATGANAGSTLIDPTIILRGGGGSQPIEGVGFGGSYPASSTDAFACFNSDGGALEPDSNCFQNANEFTFTGLHLFFDNSALAFSCDNSQDPFFTNCSVSDNEVTFSGVTNNFFSDFSAFFAPSNNCDGNCDGIFGGNHFVLDIVGLPDGVTTGYTGVADTAVTSTPEPASSLLFVIAMGAIALFLKRRSGLATA